ncbi:M56 family metallopeptidase [Paenibacillus sp. USDA918EY]|nr:M56 family metallopeptidase [Paenibacillus sp. USDA918EY]
MMNKLLELLVSLSFAGSTVVIFIFLLQCLLPEVFPTKWRYGLSKMAAAFYLIPIVLGIQLISPLFTFHTTTTVPNVNEVPSTVQPALPGSFPESHPEPFTPEVFMPEPTLSTTVALSFICLWAIGVIVFASWQTYCYRRFLKNLEHTRTTVSLNSEAATQLLSIKEALDLKSNVRLAYSSAIRSPVLVGLWKPTIYLPQENIANVDMGMVIRHELIHLKRKDLWVKAFLLGASAIHWFNPLVHMLRKDIHTWSELSCDAEVVKEMSYAERKRYGETILNVMAGSRNLPVQFCVSLSGDGKQLKRRLTFMLNSKKLKKKTLYLTIAAISLIAVVSTSAAAWASNNTPKIAANEKSHSASQGNHEVKLTVEKEPEQSKLLSSSENGKVKLYETNDGVIVDINGDQKEFGWKVLDGVSKPWVYNVDLTGDGKEEAFIILVTGHGTELDTNEAHIVNGDDLSEIKIQSVEEILADLDTEVSQKGDDLLIKAKAQGKEYKFSKKVSELALMHNSDGQYENKLTFGNVILNYVKDQKLTVDIVGNVIPVHGVLPDPVCTVHVTYKYDQTQNEFVADQIQITPE